MDEYIELGKLLKDGGLVCLAAYIKAEMNCSDIKAYDAAYDICDAVDRLIHGHFECNEYYYETEE